MKLKLKNENMMMALVCYFICLTFGHQTNDQRTTEIKKENMRRSMKN